MRRGYVRECQVCGNGLVRFWKFRDEIVGLCDECELFWSDVMALSGDPELRADGSFPGGAGRGGVEAEWKRATRRDVERAGLENAIEGYSD